MSDATLHAHQTKVDWGRWILFSVLGYGLGGFAGWFTYNFVVWGPLGLLPFFLVLALGGAIAGSLVGLAQWQTIRITAPQADKLAWMGGNIAGMAISWMLFHWFIYTLYDYRGMILATLAGGATWGLIAGLTQWNALNRRIQRLPSWFILSCVIGVVVFAVGWAWLPSIYFGYMSNSGSDVLGAAFLGNMLSIITWPLAGLLAGAATGGLIIRLLQPPEQDGKVAS